MVINNEDEILVFHSHNSKYQRILFKRDGEIIFNVSLTPYESIMKVIYMIESNMDNYIIMHNTKGDNIYIHKSIEALLKSSYFIGNYELNTYYVDFEEKKQLYFNLEDRMYMILETYVWGTTIVQNFRDDIKFNHLKNNIEQLDNI